MRTYKQIYDEYKRLKSEMNKEIQSKSRLYEMEYKTIQQGLEKELKEKPDKRVSIFKRYQKATEKNTADMKKALEPILKKYDAKFKLLRREILKITDFSPF